MRLPKKNVPCYRSQAFGIAVIVGFSTHLNYSALVLYNSKRKMLNYGCRSKHGNSIQSSHAIKCFGSSESQRKSSGQSESFLLALLLRDSSNIRVVTSNTTKVSQ